MKSIHVLFILPCVFVAAQAVVNLSTQQVWLRIRIETSSLDYFIDELFLKVSVFSWNEDIILEQSDLFNKFLSLGFR